MPPTPRDPSSTAVDPRAGKLCSACNHPRPTTPEFHCPRPACNWWRCTRCGAENDPDGRNSAVDLSGRPKARLGGDRPRKEGR